MSRETRLLVVTITISVVVLVLLSRLRFPERPPIAALSTAPLDRLAARASADELSATITALEQGLSPSLLVLRVSTGTDSTPRDLTQLLQPGTRESHSTYVPALRIAPTTAVAAIESGMTVLGLNGQTTDPAVRVRVADPLRRLALIDVPNTPGATVAQFSSGSVQTPSYVVVVEGTRAGLSFRPIFLGTGDQFSDPRWEGPLIALSSVPLTSPGALFFSTEGRFLGSALVEEGHLVMVPAADVVGVIERLSKQGRVSALDAGISLQPLTPSLAGALGVSQGVVVADVAVDGAADGVLEQADVILSVDGRPVDSPDDVLLRISESAPETPLTLEVSRDGQPLTATLRLPAPAPAQPAGAGDAGMTLASRAGRGSAVVAVMPGGPAHAAGLRAGDLILEAGGTQTPTPSRVAALVAGGGASGYLTLVVERDGRQRIAALRIATESDGPR